MQSEILRPVVVLIAWTLIMLLWMLATRMPAMKASGIDLSRLVGTKAADADKGLPRKVQWKAHNYNHLMEQPTLFYAVCGVIALSGTGDGANAWIAWAYVALRIAHSIWQATVNKVSMRFVLFLGSSLALAALTLHAAIAVF
ncbi:MAPEG family protein [Sphingomonas endolithica]|uniref:MAPEG family protein n=1 Tax=Sphingomonas endolithica TaxID=2972485 RepID=UPI0021AF47DC|nr:MAPEG family protein [Sphingomonas sp. ZFBP2030]